MSFVVTAPRLRRAAVIITELSSPTLLAPALLIAVSIEVQVRDGRQALLWGLLAGVAVGVIPLAFLRLGVRRGRWNDHHVRQQESRPLPLIVAACSVAAGLVLLVLGHAPSRITALVVAMLIGLVAVLLVSVWWKVSIHAAVAAGTAIILSQSFGVTGLAIGIIVAVAAAWSRLAAGDHTLMQVAVGLAIGATAALLYLPLQ
jgi:membrane-associated phospholipid phosphatase